MMRRIFGFSLLMLLLASCKPQEEILREQQAADEAAAAAENKPAMESQIAKTGVGIKGDSLEGTSSSNPASLVSAPALAYFKLKERVVFEIQLQKQMDLFKAYHGRPPKNHEEYMKEVVTNQIKLPTLPTGMVYRYHADTAELWVEPEKEKSNGTTRTP
ncbi:MAG: hypothetical protein ACK578_13545 [Pirellula sp.]